MKTPPREPLFLASAPFQIASTLARDFVNFSLILVFYAVCWSVGSLAYMIDNMFATRWFDSFIRMVEYLDE